MEAATGEAKAALRSMRSFATRSMLFRSQRSMANLDGVREKVPPPDLEKLTPEQMNEVFSRDLKIADPQAPVNPVRINFTTNTYEECTETEAITVFCERDGRIGIDRTIKIQEDEGTQNEEEQGEEKEEVLRNQFNFSRRAAQGHIVSYLDQGTITEAPVPKDCTGSTSQREIAAFYCKIKGIQLFEPPASAARVARVMERVVNQNMDPNISCDFKFFDDQRDALSPEQAFTLPLWEFQCDQLAGCQTTATEWNPIVQDLFAASYGVPIADKSGKSKGFLCTWSLKNHSNPRNIIELGSSATCLNWCPQQPTLLAVGTADGGVSIFDVRSRSTNPLYTTSRQVDRHSQAVTVVRWQPFDNSGNLTLLTCGLDGRLLQWTILQNEMKSSEIVQLQSGIVGLDYFDEQSQTFTLVCDDGSVVFQPRNRTTEVPPSHPAHSSPAVGIGYNKFHKDVFITYGSDFSMKLWRSDTLQQLQNFDYAPYSVHQASFAPNSSTILGAATTEGMLMLYDLAVLRYQPICAAPIIEANEGALTALSFHPKWPIILVGDERGRVHSLKLSPNLRKNTMTAEDEERSKLSQSSTNRGSRGLLPDLSQPQDDEDDDDGKAAEEELNARKEMFMAKECEKFQQSMGVSWNK